MARKTPADFLPPPSHPLQARNPEQPQDELEGVDVEATEGQAGAAGGAFGLEHRHLVVDPAGPQGRERHHAYTHALNSVPLECVARRISCSAVNS